VRTGVLAWLGTVARQLTGGVWIVAGGLKLADPYESVRAVRAYDLLPEAVVPTVGHLLPVLEVVLGALLVLGLLTRAAGAASALLFLAFIVGIASVWARGIEIECGCFGGGGAKEGASSAYPWEIARDAGLLLASLFLVWQRSSRLSLDRLVFATPDEADDLDHHLDPSGA
jgi:uncharacterized membrane protein YphA (DoxX/SURF4 family)